MFTLDDLARRRDRLKDPRVFEWVLDRLFDERNLELGPERSPFTALFDAATVAQCLADHEPDLRDTFFDALPPERFLGELPRLIQGWPAMDDEDLAGATHVIVKLEPDRALELFEKALASRKPLEPDRLYAIGVGLCELAPARGEAAARAFIRAAQATREFYAIEIVPALAVLHAMTDAAHHVGVFTRRAGASQYEDLYDQLSTDGLRDAVMYHISDPDRRRFASSAKVFADGAPLAGADEFLVADESAEGAVLTGMVATPGRAPVGAARALPYFPATVTRKLAYDAGGFYVAAVLDGFLLRARDTSALSAAEVLEHLAVNVPVHPYRDALVTRLRALPPAEVVSAFGKRKIQDSGTLGGQHLAWAAGQVADPALVPFLLEMIGPDGLPGTGEEAVDALVRIGPLAVPALVALVDDAEKDAVPRGWAAWALALIGTSEAAEALVRLFEREGALAPEWPEWVLRLPDARFLAVLEREGPGEEDFDEDPDDDELDVDRREVAQTLCVVLDKPLPKGFEFEEPPCPPGCTHEHEHDVAEAPLVAPVRVVQAGRNDPCPCGSGKKYKRCCLA